MKNTGLSFGILDVPIVGGVLREFQNWGVDTNLNDSPQWRQYGAAGIMALGTIGAVIFPPFATLILAGASISSTVTAVGVSQYYQTNPAAYSLDKYGNSSYNFSSGSAIPVVIEVPNNAGFNEAVIGAAAIAGAAAIFIAVRHKNKRRKDTDKGDYSI